MSYILEALKKSQRDREIGRIPTLESEPYSQPPESAQAANRWIVVTTALALLAATIALYALFNQHFNERESVTKTKPAPTRVTPRISAESQENSSNPVSALAQKKSPAPFTKPTTKAAPESVDSPQIERSAVQEAPKQLASKDEQSIESRSNEIPDEESPRDKELLEMKFKYQKMLRHEQALQEQQTAAATTKQSEASQKPFAAETGIKTSAQATPHYPLARELPPGILQQLPDLKISVYYYAADPTERFVILDSKKRLQGEQTPEGLTVKKIREDGLVLETAGHTFFKPR